MRLSVGKVSNYQGQIREALKDKDPTPINDHLVNVDRDIQNLWRVVNENLKFIGSQGATLKTDSALGFSYIPLLNPSPMATPTNYTGHAALAFCASNTCLYIHCSSDTAWKVVALT